MQVYYIDEVTMQANYVDHSSMMQNIDQVTMLAYYVHHVSIQVRIL